MQGLVAASGGLGVERYFEVERVAELSLAQSGFTSSRTSPDFAPTRRTRPPKRSGIPW
jgi:hypothetical protein